MPQAVQHHRLGGELSLEPSDPLSGVLFRQYLSIVPADDLRHGIRCLSRDRKKMDTLLDSGRKGNR